MCMRITVNGCMADVSIKRSCPVNLWNPAKENSKGKDRMSVELNHYLEITRSHIHQIYRELETSGKIITVEEHSVIGGLGDAVCAAVNAGSNGCQVVKMGVHDVYGHSGPGGDLITEFGLRAANIVEEALKML